MDRRQRRVVLHGQRRHRPTLLTCFSACSARARLLFFRSARDGSNHVKVMDVFELHPVHSKQVRRRRPDFLIIFVNNRS